jgi:hypothetical protein
LGLGTQSETLPEPYLTVGVENIDDFSACKITRKQDLVDLYAKPYYFGCSLRSGEPRPCDFLFP